MTSHKDESYGARKTKKGGENGGKERSKVRKKASSNRPAHDSPLMPVRKSIATGKAPASRKKEGKGGGRVSRSLSLTVSAI